MPEIWFPYGEVETLLTIQAENLGELVEPDQHLTGDTAKFANTVEGIKDIFLGDLKPTTLEFLRILLEARNEEQGLRVFARDVKRVESLIPALKGRVVETPEAKKADGSEPALHPALLEGERKAVVATAQPDPLYGLIDSKVRLCTEWASGAVAAAARARKDFEPTPFMRSESYDIMETLAGKAAGVRFVTIVPSAGRIREVLVDSKIEEVSDSFHKATVNQSRAMVVGAGGRGYDDTLSSVLRIVWSSLNGLRKSGELLIIAECSQGLGSRALELLVTGRIGGEGRAKTQYVEGLEEVYYLSKLKQEYNVLLLSGLPEVYARSRLGLSTARGSAEAIDKLLGKLGRTSKVNVVTRAGECRITSA